MISNRKKAKKSKNIFGKKKKVTKKWRKKHLKIILDRVFYIKFLSWPKISDKNQKNNFEH